MINLTVYTAVTCTYGSRKPTRPIHLLTFSVDDVGAKSTTSMFHRCQDFVWSSASIWDFFRTNYGIRKKLERLNYDISHEVTKIKMVHILTGKFFEVGRVYARSISDRIKGQATWVIKGELTSLAASKALISLRGGFIWNFLARRFQENL